MSPAAAVPAPSVTGSEGDPSGLEALPVVLALGRPDAARVAAWVEGVLGWQPVDASAEGLAARLRLLDVPAAVAGAAADPGLPTVLVVAADDRPVDVAGAVRTSRPVEVVAWPDDRDRLVEVAAAALAGCRPVATDGVTLRVGGAAGGVGTTTVALALGALGAWRAGPTLVLTAAAVPLGLRRTVALDALAGPRTFDEAEAVPGLTGLRVLRCAGHPVDAPVDPGPAVLVVRDVGVDADADVLVLRRDATGVEALGASAAAVAVVLDDGVVPPSAVVAAAAGRPVVTVPRSVRVARAGVLRRVPTALPASYLRSLRALVPGRVAS